VIIGVPLGVEIRKRGVVVVVAEQGLGHDELAD